MFRPRHLHRCLTSVVVVVTLLFSQMALANYVCPGAADPAAMAEVIAAGAPCEGMDTAQPVLCHQHAANASQSLEKVKVAAPTLPAVVQELVVPLALDAASAAALPVAATPDAWAPPNPVFLATLRLRV